MTAVPQKFSAGTTLEFTRTVPGYKPLDGWVYVLAIQAPGIAPVEATQAGDAYVISISADSTKAIPAGLYKFSERMTRAGVVREIGRGFVLVEHDLAVCGDSRTHAQRTLAILEAALEGRLTDQIVNYSIGGRAVSKIPAVELLTLANHYRVRVAAERRAAAGLSGFGSVQVNFGGAN